MTRDSFGDDGSEISPRKDPQPAERMYFHDNTTLLDNRSRDTIEEPKVILGRRLQWGQLLIHLIAVAMTAVLVYLNFAEVYAFDETAPHALHVTVAEITNSLQFAAKIHEIFIVGSLSAMVMHLVRRRLLGNKGIPLGLLTSGYQASSVEFFFSKGMWASLIKRQNVLFTFVLALTIIYANTVGPSSAIAMIPNLDWWQVPDPFGGQPMLAYSSVPGNLFYGADRHIPNQIELAGCAASNWSYACPGGGFDELYMWAAAFENVETGPNITMTEALSGAQRQLLSSYVQVNNANVSIAATHHHSILQITGLFWDYISRKKIGNVVNIQRPLLIPSDDSTVGAAVVQVQCDLFDYQAARGGQVDVRYPTSALNNFSTNAYTEGGWEVDQNLWNFDRPFLNTSNFTWTNVSTLDKGASLGAIVTLPYLYNVTIENPAGEAVSLNYSQQSLILPCTVDARWAATDLSYDPTNGNQIGTNLTDPSAFVRQDTAIDQISQFDISSTIFIDPTWAAMLNAAGVQGAYHSKETHNTSMMLALLDTFIALNASQDQSHINNVYPAEGTTSAGYKDAVLNAVSTALSLAVAEGLSRSAYAFSYSEIILNNDPRNTTLIALNEQSGAFQNLPYQTNLTQAEFQEVLPWIIFNFQRWGYGYGWDHGKTIKFGIVVLLTHAVLTVLYMIYRVWFFLWPVRRLTERGWASGAWKEIGELVALALTSSDTRARQALRGIAGGVENGDTWRLKVWVRERGPRGLQLVVGDQLQSSNEDEDWMDRKVEVGKKYL